MLYKLCIHNVIPRETTKGAIQRGKFKTTTDESNWNSKKSSKISPEGRKKKTEKQETENKKKKKCQI